MILKEEKKTISDGKNGKMEQLRAQDSPQIEVCD